MKKLALSFLLLALCSCVAFAVPRDMSLLGGAQSDPAPTSTSPHKLGSSVPWGGDLAGSSNTSQVVSGLTGQAGVVRVGADTLKKSSGASTLSIADSTNVVRDVLDMTHGRITAGGGGSDYNAVLGPCSGSETTFACLYLLPSEAATGTNYALSANAASLTFNTRNAGGSFTFENQNANPMAQFAGGTQNGVALGSALASAGHFRTPDTWLWQARNGANSGDYAVMNFSSNNTFRLGDAVNGPGAYVELNAPNAGVILGAFGGWTLLWKSTGLLATAGSVNIGTNHAAGNTTTIVAGTGQPVIVAAAQSAAGTAANFTVDTTTTDNVIIVDTSGGTVTVTLPAPTNGRKLTIIDKKNSFATHNCTLATHAAEKINNFGGSYVLTTNGYRGYVVSDGTDWYTED